MSREPRGGVGSDWESSQAHNDQTLSKMNSDVQSALTRKIRLYAYEQWRTSRYCSTSPVLSRSGVADIGYKKYYWAVYSSAPRAADFEGHILENTNVKIQA